MAAFKEIVTKAVVGKGKKYFKNNYSIDVENKPTTVLGCWVINHKFKGYKAGENIGVEGSYDVNIWYSFDNDSKTNVVKKQIDYSDLFNVKMKETSDITDDTDIMVRVLKQPTVSKVEITDTGITFDIEKELGVEIVGETKVKISIEEDEEPWEDLDQELTKEMEEEIDKVNEDYI
ncbi:MAG: outer spore coat protein CotE [Clostridium sp.]|nr:outer spore coat protein CotE [Clostridium sp.]MCM1444337.1 outer spore coat protein CotE [Candidatus Amulumruptor caecigallinarius]